MKGQLGANSYNVLKKRMTDNLLDYLAGKIIEQESSDETNVIRSLVLSRKLFAHDKVQTAQKILKKAEVVAEKINQYSLLNEIYQTALQYSYNLSEDEHKLLLENFEANRNELVEQSKLNMAFSVVHRAYLKVEKEGQPINLESLLSDVYKRFNISEDRGYNFMSLYQLVQLADLSGASSKQYHSVDIFFVSKLDEIEGGPLDTEKHLIYHIDLLYLVANIYFRKHDFESSLFYLEKMLFQMNRFDKRFYRDRLVKYTTLKALCLNYLSQWKQALCLLDELIDSSKYSFDDLMNPVLAKMTIHLQQSNLNEAKSLMSKFPHTDGWYEKIMGIEWLLNKNFAEIILHIEFNNVDYLESRIKSLKRKLTQENVSNLDYRIRVFLDLLSEISANPNKLKSEKFKLKVANSMEWKPREEEDIFMMSFYAWLKAKLSNQDIYQTTIDLFSK
ncbi:hypothetical protein K6119_12075 [Paracrocinitomix mangrovi]|uniref:hypothetical protein n=1 Tax=Paracrocinitomix mangrovi TaxID=2862509 RepID=UPI001EDA80D8|nr:hypothetical protein [Paracrocinitomix mangrovi]UKN00469.1 hypothetical protein K6119_12075 [Paracrocinitomix mangrovi]